MSELHDEPSESPPDESLSSFLRLVIAGMYLSVVLLFAYLLYRIW